ncbi:SIR2 family protein [Helicobacter salomonis]|uniref:SIR2 family protein n=1 Tax=Helicobacter salomonis TaxID=56878 RepID=UPI000CF0B12F|nr:SIR2 family protein [Helicobacter salomonis]
MTDNEYRSFIETSLENIRKAHNENYLSIFAGAGISAFSGLPRWGELIDILKEKLYGYAKSKKYDTYSTSAKKHIEQHGFLSDEDLINLIKMLEKKLFDDIKRDGDYTVLAEKFFNQFGHNIYYHVLREALKTPDGNNAEPNTLHFEIVKLNLKNLITTNWDNLFELASSKVKKLFDIVEMDANIGNSTGLPKLLKIHGSLNRRNVVFREKDYLEYSHNFPLIENYVKGVFATDVVVLIGYSLGDPNVKQIISWVNSCSDNVKPIYFIKTNDPFERIEFEFYKNKNIHVLYLSELFTKRLDERRERKRELKHFFEKIKEKYNATPVLSNEEIEKIRHTFTCFNSTCLNSKTLEEKIRTLRKSKEISFKDKCLRYFLLFENRIDDENMSEIDREYKRGLGEVIRNEELEIWFSNASNRYWMFYSNEYDGLGHNKWNKFLSTLTLSERSKLEHLIRLEKYFERKVERIRLYLKARKFFNDNDNSFGEVLEKLHEFDRTRIGNCLTIPRFESCGTAYARALECCWYEMRGILKTKKEMTSLSVRKEVFSYSIRYFRTRELKDIFLRYFEGLTLRIEINEEFLREIFTNICSKFKQYGAFTTRGSRWFDNFLFLASHCSLAQSTFDRIVEEVNHKIQARITSLDQYEQLEKFVLEQSKNDVLSLQKCLEVVLSYLNLFIENKAGGYEIEARSIFSKIVEKIKIVGEEYKNLITEFVDRVHQYVRIDDNAKPSFTDLLTSNPDLQEDLKAIINSDEVQYGETFLPLIKALYQSSNEDVKKAIKRKLRGILKHKDQYEQTNRSEKYCKWLEELIKKLDS